MLRHWQESQRGLDSALELDAACGARRAVRRSRDGRGVAPHRATEEKYPSSLSRPRGSLWPPVQIDSYRGTPNLRMMRAYTADPHLAQVGPAVLVAGYGCASAYASRSAMIFAGIGSQSDVFTLLMSISSGID
jgi:hypothetical protein